jgi:hypothetical protein
MTDPCRPQFPESPDLTFASHRFGPFTHRCVRCGARDPEFAATVAEDDLVFGSPP